MKSFLAYTHKNLDPKGFDMKIGDEEMAKLVASFDPPEEHSPPVLLPGKSKSGKGSSKGGGKAASLAMAAQVQQLSVTKAQLAAAQLQLTQQTLAAENGKHICTYKL